MKRRIIQLICFVIICFSTHLAAKDFTFIDILEGLHETRYDRFSGYDGFDWMVRSYDEYKLVVIFFDSTTEYFDFRADASAVLSRFFQRGSTSEHRQERREDQVNRIKSIKNENKRAIKWQAYKEKLRDAMMTDTYFSLSAQNYILNSQLQQAWKLFLDVLVEESYQDYRILMVGHSFGSLLAQATTSRALMLNLIGDLNREIYAVTFGALGANGAVKNYLPKSYLSQFIYTFNRKEDIIVRIAWGGSLGREFWWPEHIRHVEIEDNAYAFLIDRILANHHLIPIILDLQAGLLPYADCFPWMASCEE
ncbi:lipase family protein [Entomospira nematocerorum]|uniref:Lipase family protein n=1 Tax=Entomospira nematocerorum TaxID=2719987 RepID=A0A968KVA4_9SPIO|nr:lipase family protein [Entomospira nematocera]NIZ47073.1 lipase family protein [Entomospira nematocera]WDI34382.1 lipase family protein [Entomospira nematocera]